MKKGQNSRNQPDDCDESLPRTNILRGKRNFERLFERSTVLRSGHIHFRYRLYDDPEEGFYISFIVAKRVGRAVVRNRIKRHMREAYRKQACLLDDLKSTRTFGLHGAFMAQSATIDSARANRDIKSLMEQMIVRLKPNSESGKRETPTNLS